MSEPCEYLNLSEGALAVRLVLKRTDLLYGHFSDRQTIKSGAVEASMSTLYSLSQPRTLTTPPTHHTIPHAPSPMYAKPEYRGPTAKDCPRTNSGGGFPMAMAILIWLYLREHLYLPSVPDRTSLEHCQIWRTSHR